MSVVASFWGTAASWLRTPCSRAYGGPVPPSCGRASVLSMGHCGSSTRSPHAGWRELGTDCINAEHRYRQCDAQPPCIVQQRWDMSGAAQYASKPAWCYGQRNDTMEFVAAMAQAGWAAHRRRGFIAVEAAASAFLPAGKRGDQVTRLRRLVPQQLDINLYAACAPRETSTRCSVMFASSTRVCNHASR